MNAIFPQASKTGSTLASITVAELHRQRAADTAGTLIDVRTPAEYAGGHVPGALLLPLGDLTVPRLNERRNHPGGPVYVLCQSGGRARRAIVQLAAAGVTDCVLVEGGTQAWQDAGLPLERTPGGGGGLPIMRQVQIIVGALSATGALLALTVHPWFAGLPLLMGSGLLFAGITGFCGLAVLLAKMPWNRSAAAPTGSGSCCTASATGDKV